MAVQYSNNYPTLTPKEFMDLATIQGGLSVEAAIALSGLPENTWNSWINRKKTRNAAPKPTTMLWLGSLAERQGWIKTAA